MQSGHKAGGSTLRDKGSPQTSRAQAKKEQIITGLGEVRRKIVALAASLPPNRQDEIFLGVWSVKDLLAHLVGWDLANLAMAKDILAGRLPGFYAYYDPDWRSFNAQLVARHRVDDYAQLLSSVHASHRQLVEFLQTVPAEEFGRDRGLRFKGYRVTIAAELETEIRDEGRHCEQLRAFSDSPNSENLNRKQHVRDAELH